MEYLLTFLALSLRRLRILLLYPIFVLIYVFVISKHPSAFRNWKRAQEMGRL